LSQAISISQLSWTQEELNAIAIDAIQDVKGKGIVKLDLRHLDDAPTDYFVICHGESNTQVNAIAGRIQKRLKDELGVHASHVEGTRGGTWVCLDFFNTVIHVFYHETRNFYELEELWGDARFTEYETL
jgi:ribosome-associated protein